MTDVAKLIFKLYQNHVNLVRSHVLLCMCLRFKYKLHFRTLVTLDNAKQHFFFVLAAIPFPSYQEEN
jgi:hypothetical protein